MEEINRSKSVNKETRRRGKDSDYDSDDDYNAYKRWKERKKKKKKKNEKNNDDREDRKNIRKIRNVSSDKKQRNANTEMYNDNDNLNINYEMEKKAKKEKQKENTKNLAQSASNNVFSFGLNNKQDENNNNLKKSYSQQDYNTLKTTSINFTPMGIIPTGYYNQMANQQNNKTPTPENNQAYETPQNYSSPMAPGSLYTNPTQYDQPRPKTQY
jgi:hypothetical protein